MTHDRHQGNEVPGPATIYAEMSCHGSADGDHQTVVQAQLSVRHGREAVEFYKAAFGAVERYRVGGTDQHPAVVSQLTVGDAYFWVADESPEHENHSPESLNGSTTRMLLVVDDPDRTVAQALTAGAALIAPVTEAHRWRLGRIKDPFGHHWEIGKPLVPWPPTEPSTPGAPITFLPGT